MQQTEDFNAAPPFHSSACGNRSLLQVLLLLWGQIIGHYITFAKARVRNGTQICISLTSSRPLRLVLHERRQGDEIGVRVPGVPARFFNGLLPTVTGGSAAGGRVANSDRGSHPHEEQSAELCD